MLTVMLTLMLLPVILWGSAGHKRDVITLKYFSYFYKVLESAQTVTCVSGQACFLVTKSHPGSIALWDFPLFIRAPTATIPPLLLLWP